MAEAGLVPRCRIGVHDALMDRVVDERQGRREQRLRRCLVFCIEGDPELADLVPEPGTVHAVELRSLTGLLDAL